MESFFEFHLLYPCDVKNDAQTQKNKKNEDVQSEAKSFLVHSSRRSFVDFRLKPHARFPSQTRKYGFVDVPIYGNDDV